MAASLLAGTNPTRGQATIEWGNALGGAYDDGGNWVGGVAPGSSDTAVFDLDATYTVDFNNDHTNRYLHLRKGDVSFDLGSHTLMLTSSFSIVAGVAGGDNATLRLLSGTLSGPWASIGQASFARGTLIISGLNSTWTNSGQIWLGESGFAIGRLTIADGGQVFSTDGDIGRAANSQGFVTITGAGSHWNVGATSFVVGNAGAGELTIENGGHVSNGLGVIGNNPSGGVGTATVRGLGSTWTNANLGVGGNVTTAGGTGSLSVADGGHVDVAGMLRLWSSGTLTLNGGSITTGSFDRTLGTFNHHDGTLTVDGGAYTQASGALSIDGNTPGASPELVLTGGATTSGIEELRVGGTNQGSLTVSGGSVLSNSSNVGYLGFGPGSSGVATITGPGSSWTNGQISVGLDGQGTLVIDDGAQVISNSGASIGTSSGSGTATVTGAGSNWTLNNQLTLGTSYTGAVGSATLNIAAGATVNAPGATVWTRGTVNVQTGGTLAVADGLTNKGAFEIAAGGAVSASFSNTGNLANHGTLTGNISTHFDGVLSGTGAFNGTVTISSGGTFSPGDSPGTATTGPTAWLSSGNYLWEINALAGFGGTEGSDPGWDLWHAGDLSITGPFTIELATLTAGNVAGPLAGWDPLTDHQWRIATSLSNAFSSLGNLVLDASGFQNSLDGGSFTLSASPGGNDLFLNFSAFADPSLQIDGGQLVVFNDGLTRAYTEVRVGIDTTGELRVLNASTLENSSFASIGVNAGSSGKATVSGDGSAWTNSANIIVGDAGMGALTVEDGGQVSNANGFIGSNSGSSGAVTVSGFGSNWNNSGSLFIGGSSTVAGGTGTLTVGLGSTVNVAGTTRIWNEGTINLNGGTLNTGALVFAGSTFNFTLGTVNITGAQAIDSSFLQKVLGSPQISFGRNLLVGGITTLTQPLTLDGGTLAVGQLVNAALLEFERGTLSITGADGLVVGAGGPFGSAVTVSAGQTVNVTNTATVQPGSSLLIESGGTANAGTLANSGTVVLHGVNSTLGGGDVNNAGVLRGDGRVAAAVSNLADGEIRAEAGNTLRFTGTSGTNAGRITLQGGALEFAQAFTNAASGAISGRGTLFFDGGLTNAGKMQFSGGPTDIYGNVSFTGGAGGGEMINSGGANVVTLYDDVVHNGDEIRTSPGNTTVFFGDVTGLGPFTGTGAVRFEGTFSPGNSPGRVSMEGDVQLGGDARLVLEFSGNIAGDQYDQLRVGGLLSLDGALDVTLLNGFAPRYGDSFDLFDFGALAGRFDTMNLPVLGAGLAWDTSAVYSTGAITAVPEPAGWLLAVVVLATALGFRRSAKNSR